MISAVEAIAAIDDKLSKRFLELDPAGYFIIYLDREAGLICAKHFSNEVNEQGLDHAAYLGRELMRAELALATGQDYVQD